MLTGERAQKAALGVYHIERAIAALNIDPTRGVRAVNDARSPDSLLAKAEKLCSTGSSKTPQTVRTFHHLSCTGGTLLSKCIASMSNVLLLNEIDYASPLVKGRKGAAFSPSDLISLIYQNDDVANLELIHRVFVADISLLIDDQRKIGRTVVLRDHSHSHFLVGGRATEESTLLEISRKHFSVKSLVSVRDPVDSYASMVVKGWHKHFSPSTFDEYCRRYILFLDRHKDVPIVRYEDFVAEPQKTMQEMCRHLDLEFFPDFADVYDSFVFSGDSGRSGGAIERRERRSRAPEYLEEIAQSKAYDALCHKLGYASA